LTNSAPLSSREVKMRYEECLQNWGNANLRKIWIKMELPVVNQYGWASVRQRAEFDCKEERKSALAGNAFSKPNFEGKILFEASKGAAQDVAPQSVDWNILKIVCRK